MTAVSKSELRYPPLLPQQLRELATLITSGVPLADAWAKSSFMSHPAGLAIHRKLEKGSSLPAALRAFNLVTAPLQISLAAADNAGSLGQSLQELAADYEQREANVHKLRSKFYVIYLLLFVGWGASLALAAVSTPEYFFTTIFRNSIWCLVCLVMIKMVTRIVLKDGWWWLEQAWSFGAKGHKAYQWSLITNWYALLSKQLKAGVDIASAIRGMAGLLGQASYRKAINNAASAVGSGHSLSQALAESDLLPDSAFRTILDSAEASGRLAETLDQQVCIAEQQLEIFRNNVMFWIPKGLYGLCGAAALVMVF